MDTTVLFVIVVFLLVVTSAKHFFIDHNSCDHVDMFSLYHLVHILLGFPFDNADTPLNSEFHLRYKRKSI